MSKPMARLTKTNVVVSVRFQAPYCQGDIVKSTDGSHFAGKVIYVNSDGSQATDGIFHSKEALIALLEKAIADANVAVVVKNSYSLEDDD